MNNCTFMGRLVADPELRHTQSQTPVCSFTLAVDRAYAPKGEERKADFIQFVAWKHTAEFITRFFRKGQRMAVVGALQSRKYTDKNGEARTAYEIVVENAFFADGKIEGASSPSHAANAPQAAFTSQNGANTSGGDFEEIIGDDDLPF